MTGDRKLRFIDQTCQTPAQNMAFEQALLEHAESSGAGLEFLRIWRPRDYMVVLGRGGKIGEEVVLDRCQEDGVKVLRRFSGGGTIVTGPGCLMYALVLSHQKQPALKDIAFAHRLVGQSMQEVYAACGHSIELRGHSDFCLGNKKFSGNALRVGRTHSVYHGTLLIDFDLQLISRYLKLPVRRPDYRQSRGHLDFVVNLAVDERKLVDSLRDVFGAEDDLADNKPAEINLDKARIHELLESRYENDDWNFRY